MVRWQPPPTERHNGRITYYKVFYVESGRPENLADSIRLNRTELLIDELRRWTEYKVWVLAGTSVGDGPKSYPLIIQTQEDGKYGNMKSYEILTQFLNRTFDDN